MVTSLTGTAVWQNLALGKQLKSWAVLPGEGLHTPGDCCHVEGDCLRLCSRAAEQDRAQDSTQHGTDFPLLSSYYVSGVLLVTGPVISLNLHQDSVRQM